MRVASYQYIRAVFRLRRQCVSIAIDGQRFISWLQQIKQKLMKKQSYMMLV